MWFFDAVRDYASYFTVTHISVHSHIFTNRCLVAPINDGRSPNSGFLDYPPTSSTSFSQLQLTTTERQQFSNLLTTLHFTSLHFTKCPTYNISARTAQNTSFFFVVVQLLSWERVCVPLFSNGCCIRVWLSRNRCPVTELHAATILWLVPFVFFIVLYWLIILCFGSIWSQLLTVSQNEPIKWTTYSVTRQAPDK
jgi:hypothetical protein